MISDKTFESIVKKYIDSIQKLREIKELYYQIEYYDSSIYEEIEKKWDQLSLKEIQDIKGVDDAKEIMKICSPNSEKQIIKKAIKTETNIFKIYNLYEKYIPEYSSRDIRRRKGSIFLDLIAERIYELASKASDIIYYLNRKYSGYKYKQDIIIKGLKLLSSSEDAKVFYWATLGLDGMSFWVNSIRIKWEKLSFNEIEEAKTFEEIMSIRYYVVEEAKYALTKKIIELISTNNEAEEFYKYIKCSRKESEKDDIFKLWVKNVDEEGLKWIFDIVDKDSCDFYSRKDILKLITK